MELDAVDRQLAVAHRHDLAAELLQEMYEVVRERIVVVDHEDHLAPASATSTAASSAASLFRHSWCSAAGSESATIPPPACRCATPSLSTSVRIAMQVS